MSCAACKALERALVEMGRLSIAERNRVLGIIELYIERELRHHDEDSAAWLALDGAHDVISRIRSGDVAEPKEGT